MCGLAALALYDGEAEITAQNISALLSASNNNVAAYWPGLFAGALKNNVDSLLFNLSSGGGAAAPAAAADAPAAGKPAAAPAKEEKKKEEAVDPMDGGMNLFGGGGGGGDY